MTIPISAELLIALNREHGGPGAGVSNLNGVEACAARPFSGFGGVEKFPSIWDKAASLLHGISSTQHFTDGNKRTAVMATLYFLEQNGETLRDLPRISKESAVLASATNLLTTEEVSEWLYENRLRPSDRVDYAVLGMPIYFGPTPNEKFETWGYRVPVQGITLRPDDKSVTLAVLTRLNWFEVDRDTTKQVSVRLRNTTDSAYTIDQISAKEVTGLVESLWDNPVFPNGFQSWNEYFVLKLNVIGRGQNHVELLIDGEVAWSDSLTVEQRDNVPDYLH